MTLLYIDPGAGSLVIQALIAAVVAIPFFFRTKLRDGVRWIRRARTGDATEPGPRGGTQD